MTAARTTLTGRLAVPGAPGIWCHSGTVTAYPTIPIAASDGATMAGAVGPAVVDADGRWTLELLHYRDPDVTPQAPADLATWLIRFEGVRATVAGRETVIEIDPVPINPPAGEVAFETVTPTKLPNGKYVTAGATPVITATATTGAPGSEAVVTTSGTPEAPVLAFTLPPGGIGRTPEIAVTVATGAPGSNATVTQTGTPEAPVLAFTLPRGDEGQSGVLPAVLDGGNPDGSDGPIESIDGGTP